MHRSPVYRGEPRGDLDCPDRIARPKWPHRDDEWTGKGTGRRTGDIGAVHRDIRPASDVTQFDPILDERLLERERAAKSKADEIIAPDMKELGRLFDEFTAAPHPIARQIAAEI